jgi:hypothetical protein
LHLPVVVVVVVVVFFFAEAYVLSHYKEAIKIF